MEFKLTNTERKLNELSDKFKKDLIDALAPHRKSGKLEQSIELKFKKTTNGYEMDLSALEYIKFIDEGRLLKNFIKEKTSELKKELLKPMKKDMLELIKKELKK